MLHFIISVPGWTNRCPGKPGAAQKGENQLPKVIQDVTFKDGVEVINTPAQNAA
jgi:hypothetical protein